MNDKEYEKLKSRIKKYVDKWLPMLGLKWWTVSLYYEREKCSTKSVVDDGNMTGMDIGAKTYIQYPYKTAQVYFYLPGMEGLDSAGIDRLVLHEFIHILTEEIKDSNVDHNHCERGVSDLTDAFLWTYKRVK